MSGTVVERIRSDWEDLETIEKAASKVLVEQSNKAGSNQTSRVAYDYALVDLVEQSRKKAEELERLYDDKDGQKEEELSSLLGKGGEIWSNFYRKIKEAQDYYARNSEKNSMPKVPTVESWFKDSLAHQRSEFQFSGEESFGRYVDMHELYDQFVNLKRYAEFRRKQFLSTLWEKYEKKHQAKADKGKKSEEKILSQKEFLAEHEGDYNEIDYISYLKTFDQFHHIPRHLKYKQKDYLEYLKALQEYLRGFIQRQRPLFDIGKLEKESEDEFQERWAAKSVQGWSSGFTRNSSLYCPPTDRLFANEQALEGHKKGKEFKKAAERMAKMHPAEIEALNKLSEKRDMELARLEVIIQKYKETLADTIDETVEYLTVRQARTLDEIETDIWYEEHGGRETFEDEKDDVWDKKEQDSDSDSDDSDDGDNRALYNPLNLPIGWDGKPIPFWLYKLHGLGKPFRCEICGNYTYWGRRAFERHFTEWRHAHGMKCLRIPNSKHFHDITSIEDAITLYEKLRREQAIQGFDPDADIECEDNMGNVMNQRTYRDMLKQGLI